MGRFRLKVFWNLQGCWSTCPYYCIFRVVRDTHCIKNKKYKNHNRPLIINFSGQNTMINGLKTLLFLRLGARGGAYSAPPYKP
jgi:hypothetical protein